VDSRWCTLYIRSNPGPRARLILDHPKSIQPKILHFDSTQSHQTPLRCHRNKFIIRVEQATIYIIHAQKRLPTSNYRVFRSFTPTRIEFGFSRFSPSLVVFNSNLTSQPTRRGLLEKFIYVDISLLGY
jgi:hypothetical protein